MLTWVASYLKAMMQCLMHLVHLENATNGKFSWGIYCIAAAVAAVCRPGVLFRCTPLRRLHCFRCTVSWSLSSACEVSNFLKRCFDVMIESLLWCVQWSMLCSADHVCPFWSRLPWRGWSIIIGTGWYMLEALYCHAIHVLWTTIAFHRGNNLSCFRLLWLYFFFLFPLTANDLWAALLT